MLSSDNMSLHLITICMGLIIAFGLQQLIALFRRRRIRRQSELQAKQSASPADDASSPSPPTL